MTGAPARRRNPATLRSILMLLTLPALPAWAATPPAVELAGCPRMEQLQLPAFFDYEPDGRTREAVGAVILPAAFGSVARVVDDVAGYPEWVLLGREGEPLLRDMQFDSASGRGAIVVGPAETRIDGVLTRTALPTSLALELEMLAGERVKEATMRIEVAPSPDCAEATRVVLNARWKVGLLTHVVANDAVLSVPAFVLLAVRDDLAARVLAEDEAVRNRLQETISALQIPGLEAADGGSRSLIHFEPGAVRTDGDKLDVVVKVLRPIVERGKTPRPVAMTRAFFEALSGPHWIVAYHTAFAAPGLEHGGRMLVPGTSGSVSYQLDLTEEGFGLGFGVTGPPR